MGFVLFSDAMLEFILLLEANLIFFLLLIEFSFDASCSANFFLACSASRAI